MARIKALTSEEAGSASETLKSLQKKIGRLPNIYGSMAHSPATLNINDEEFVEILANVSINLFANYFNNIVQTEIAFPLVEVQQATA